MLGKSWHRYGHWHSQAPWAHNQRSAKKGLFTRTAHKADGAVQAMLYHKRQRQAT
jgi:hypothetical protein